MYTYIYVCVMGVGVGGHYIYLVIFPLHFIFCCSFWVLKSALNFQREGTLEKNHCSYSCYYTGGQDGLLVITQVGKMGFLLLHRWARWASYWSGGQDGLLVITQVGKMGFLLLHRLARWASCYYTGWQDGLLLVITQVARWAFYYYTGWQDGLLVI